VYPRINGHFRNLNWRYLPYMVQYLHFRILKFPLIITYSNLCLCQLRRPRLFSIFLGEKHRLKASPFYQRSNSGVGPRQFSLMIRSPESDKVCFTIPKLDGWWFQTWLLFSIIYGMSSFPLMNSYFSRWLLHHQPEIFC